MELSHFDERAFNVGGEGGRPRDVRRGNSLGAAISVERRDERACDFGLRRLLLAGLDGVRCAVEIAVGGVFSHLGRNGARILSPLIPNGSRDEVV